MLPHLTTPRLLLRPFIAADAEDVQRLAGDPAVADTTLNLPHPYPDGVAGQWIATHQEKFAAGEDMVLAITTREAGVLTGAMGLTINRRFDHAELGYWIGRPYWGHGYCTEAGKAVLEYAFTNLSLNRIFAHYLTRNPASGRVMEKLGMMREGLARQHVKKGEHYEDIYLYGILRDEWRRLSGAR